MRSLLPLRFGFGDQRVCRALSMQAMQEFIGRAEQFVVESEALQRQSRELHQTILEKHRRLLSCF